MNFVRGQKTPLSKLTQSTTLEVGLQLSAKNGTILDFACFGLDAAGKLSDDRYLIFYNQKNSPCGSLAVLGASSNDQEVFRVDLGRLPESIKRLVFTVAIDGTGSMSDLNESALRLTAGGQEIARFPFSGSDFGLEKAIMIAEIYFKDVWRFAAVGQGFSGGLSSLLTHFGGEEAKPAAPAPVPVAPAPIAPAPIIQPRPAPVPVVTAPIPAPVPVAPAPVAPPPKVNLGKVTLEKRGAKQAVNLRKGGNTQPIHVNLNWDGPAKKGFLGGMFGGNPAKPDLDLGCMYLLTDGSKGVIQPLGNKFGSRHAPPFIYLDKDDRSGASVDGENLYIVRPDLIAKVMIFALIYEGTANFSTVNGRLTIKDQEGNEIMVRMDNPDVGNTFCTVCLIEKKGDHIEITKEEYYCPDHSFADRKYGFGFRWQAGQK